MSFLLVIKKGGGDLGSRIDEAYLNGLSAPSYAAEAVSYVGSERVKLWRYDYRAKVPGNEFVSSESGDVYFTEGTAISLESGVVDSKTAYELAKSQSDDLQGDYLIFGLDESGNGGFFSTLMSFNRLFFYENDEVAVFSSEIRLIFNSVSDFRGVNVGNFFDFNFIYESIFSEWAERNFSSHTFIEGIRRIPSTTRVNFSDYSYSFEDCQFDQYDEELGHLYLTNKAEFYDLVMDTLKAAVDRVVGAISDESIEVLLSGGLDSRVSIALLEGAANANGIEIKTKCWGPESHPDVVIGKRIAETLRLPFNNVTGDGKVYIPERISDYQKCISISQGDWNSNNFRTSNQFVKRVVVSGQDNYKRHNWNKIFSMNRWYAARMSYTKTLPILSNNIVNKVALVYGKHNFHHGLFEFVYELLRRFSPSLLEIPFVGMQLPQHPVEPFSTVKESKIMPSHLAKAHWDEELVINCIVAASESKSEEVFLIDDISTDERKRRIAMDFASIARQEYI